MSDNFIKTNQGFVRMSAVVQVATNVSMPGVTVLHLAGNQYMPHYIDRPIEDVVAELEGSEPTRPEKAPQGITRPVAKPAQERLGFGSVVDAKAD